MENEVEAEIDAVDDVEQKEVTPQDQINDMIAAAIKGDYVNANNHFNDILGDRVSTALDQEKTRVASSVYGSDEEDVADEDDVSDEEMEAELSDDDDSEESEKETEEISDDLED